jgi:uncharacterized protein YbaR (Trm112 family)
MVAEELLALLRCPETQQPLTIAADGIVAQLEAERVAGRLRDCTGRLVGESMEGGLVRADGTRLFPIRRGIPILMTSEAVDLPVMVESP